MENKDLTEKLETSKIVKLFELKVNEYHVIPDLYDCEYKPFSHEEFGPFSEKDFMENKLDSLRREWENRGYRQLKEENVFRRDNYEIHYHLKDFSVSFDEIGEHKGKLYLFNDKIPREIITE